jgi:protein-disulfide isomerase
MHRAFCPWCLATAAVFLIAAALDFRLPRAIGPLSPVTLFILFQLFTFSALGLIAFVLPAATPAGFQQRLTQTLPALIDPSVLEEIGPCGFATNAPPLPNFRSVRAPLAQGHPAAPNHVLVFFDPFCPLCRVLDRNLEEVLRNAAGSVRVVTVPVAHLAGSDDAVRLLFAASHQPGGGELTSRLVALLFTLQDQSHPPASREQWSVLLTKAGLPAAALLRELDSPAVTRAMQEARNAFEAAGATVTPCVLINGRPVTSSASSIRSGCLSRLITETSSRRVAE